MARDFFGSPSLRFLLFTFCSMSGFSCFALASMVSEHGRAGPEMAVERWPILICRKNVLYLFRCHKQQ